jgi:hypothetical protein
MHPPMTLTKTLSILLLSSSLAFVGCKKKEDAATAPATGSATKPAEATPVAAAPAAAPATPPAAPAAGGTTIASDEEYVAKATAAMDKMIDVFKTAGTDCDKLADGITKFVADNADFIKSSKAYEKTHPDAQKKFDEAGKDKMKSFEEAAGPAMTSCKDNKKVADAMTKMSAD